MGSLEISRAVAAPQIASRKDTMNKHKKTTRVKLAKLKLAKETVQHLTSDMLKAVAGGAQPVSLNTECISWCDCP